MSPDTHHRQNRAIVDEFSRQAALPAERIPELTQASAIGLMLETAGVTAEEQLFIDSLVDDNLDMRVRQEGTEIHVGYPSLILVSEPAADGG
jgi:hypothetical protein